MSEIVTDAKSKTMTRRSILVGSVMSLTAAVAYAGTPRRAEHRLAKQKISKLIPAEIGPWRFASPAGLIVAREEDDQPVDGYDQLLTRTYEAPGLPSVMLLLAYGSTQGGSLQLHRPETCYPGQGFKLSDFREIDFDFVKNQDVHARSFTATRDDRVERLVYWTRISNSFPRNTAEEYSAIIGGVFRGIIPDGILVRVSTLSSDIAGSDAALTAFARDLVRSATPAGRTILLGDTIATEYSGTGAGRRI